MASSDAPRSLLDEDAASLLGISGSSLGNDGPTRGPARGSALEPSRPDEFARVSVHSQTSDYLAVLAGSQMSRGSSISSDSERMLLDGSSDSTMDRLANSFLDSSYLLSESINRARQRQEEFRQSLDSYHLDGSMTRDRQQQQEDFRLASSVVGRDHNSSIRSREDAALSIGSVPDIRSRRQGGENFAIKKRTKPTKMNAVDFDLAPGDEPKQQTRVKWAEDVNFNPAPDDKPDFGGSLPNGPNDSMDRSADSYPDSHLLSESQSIRDGLMRGFDVVDNTPAPDDGPRCQRRSGRKEDAAVVQSLLTFSRGGGAARVASDAPRPPPTPYFKEPADDEGPGPRGIPWGILQGMSPEEARQLLRQVAAMERTGRSRRLLMAQTGATGPSAAFFAESRDTLTDRLEGNRRRLKRYADSKESATNGGAS